MKISQEHRIEHIVSRMLADRAEDAPVDAIRYARNLFRTRAAEPTRSALKRILAVLQVDLAPNRAAFGERSAAGAQARQMLFDAGEHAVDLRITAVDKKLNITGQLLGSGFDDGHIEISDGDTLARTEIRGSGRFEFAGLSVGEYSMTITGSEIQILMEKIDIR